MVLQKYFPESSSGRTKDSGSFNGGSNPSSGEFLLILCHVVSESQFSLCLARDLNRIKSTSRILYEVRVTRSSVLCKPFELIPELESALLNLLLVIGHLFEYSVYLVLFGVVSQMVLFVHLCYIRQLFYLF